LWPGREIFWKSFLKSFLENIFGVEKILGKKFSAGSLKFFYKRSWGLQNIFAKLILVYFT